jgi:carbonic anhydrase/acetyltransferase-like protein (isoleucine patch superfamily)
MKQDQFNNKKPQVAASAYLQDGVRMVGDVEIGEKVSIWYNSTLRADLNKIIIGDNTNIQELSCLHVDKEHPTIVKENVTIGHGCIIHGCTIEENVLVGMGSTILSGVVIPKNCIIGANSLVTSSQKLQENSLILGSPARVSRSLKDEEVTSILTSAHDYAKLAQTHKNQ